MDNIKIVSHILMILLLIYVAVVFSHILLAIMDTQKRQDIAISEISSTITNLNTKFDNGITITIE